MQTRPFGEHGPSVSVVGQGTWQLEARWKDAVRTLRHGVELGMNHVDTAEIYGDGAVERLVGEALQGVRDQVFLVSKIDPRRAIGAEAARACEESLTRLRTDHLDAYLLHWLPPHSLEQAIEAMEALAESGRILRWGVSNFDEVKLEQAVSIAGAGRIACNQILYHPGERAVEHAVLPCCRRHGIAAVGYSPFAVGAFPGPDTRGGRALRTVAARHEATPQQVALAFLTRLPGTFTIPRSSSPAHMADNAAAADIELSPQEVATIEDGFPLGDHEWGVPTW